MRYSADADLYHQRGNDIRQTRHDRADMLGLDLEGQVIEQAQQELEDNALRHPVRDPGEGAEQQQRQSALHPGIAHIGVHQHVEALVGNGEIGDQACFSEKGSS